LKRDFSTRPRKASGGGVRDAALLEQEPEPSTGIRRAERGLRLGERRVCVVEATLEPLRPGDLRQQLREVGAALLPLGSWPESEEAPLARGRVAEVPELVEPVELDGVRRHTSSETAA